MPRPFSQACENNKHAILEVLRGVLPGRGLVLELGSGTAQHINYFAAALPGLQWLPSELPTQLPALLAGLEGLAPANVLAPLALDASQLPWPIKQVDALFTANTLHIMPLSAAEQFFTGAAQVLVVGGLLCVYGPFKYGGEFTTASNASFDHWLKQRDVRSGVRDFEQVDAWARQQGLQLQADHAMPANNQLLVWRKVVPVAQR